MNEKDWRNRKNLDYMEKYSSRRIDITQRSHCMAPTADSMCCVNNKAFLNNTIGKRQHITLVSVCMCVCVCVRAYVCLSSSVCPAAGVMRGRSGTGTSCWVSRHGMTTLALWPGQNSQKHMIQYEDTHSHTHSDHFLLTSLEVRWTDPKATTCNFLDEDRERLTTRATNPKRRYLASWGWDSVSHLYPEIHKSKNTLLWPHSNLSLQTTRHSPLRGKGKLTEAVIGVHMMQGVVLTSGISQPNWSCEHECKWSCSVQCSGGADHSFQEFSPRTWARLFVFWSGYLSKRRMTAEYQVAQQI